jgi:hypothetical protein
MHVISLECRDCGADGIPHIDFYKHWGECRERTSILRGGSIPSIQKKKKLQEVLGELNNKPIETVSKSRNSDRRSSFIKHNTALSN